MEFFSLSNNRISGSVPAGLCNLTRLEAFTANRMRLSGVLPSCLGSLSRVQVLSVARNFLSGSLPLSMDRMTALETLFMFSNGFVCDAPGLQAATNLSRNIFRGNIFPANLALGVNLAKKGGLQTYGTTFKPPFTVRNNELLYTGNSRLTTAASVLGQTKAPRSLDEDGIRRGEYSLFGGYTQRKQFWYLVFPGSLLLFVAAMAVGAKEVGWTKAEVRATVKLAFLRDWQAEPLVLKRYIKHGSTLTPYLLGAGLILVVFYAVQSLKNVRCGSNELPDLTIVSVGEALFPWDNPGEGWGGVEERIFTGCWLLRCKGTIDRTGSLAAERQGKRERGD
eukprot:TRINITY_DN4096_c0_g1_i9.p1 TRINITY_DN4096_c0_g1~~TRINITY_DN4096_c0_g1_i9.p1  ORF type:complete len:336 (-),score=72.90 TRINITY_DN4096_c0_g1_i9:81-1088(-)